MIKILHLLSSGLVGGTERMTIRLIRGMDPERFSNQVAFFRGGGPIADELAAMGVPVTILEWSPARTWVAAQRLIGLLRREQFDIVQVYGLKANMFTRPIATLCRVPRLITAQRSVDHDRRFHHSLMDRLTSPMVDLYLSNSRAAAELLVTRERIPSSKVRTVHNGIDHRPIRAAMGERAAVRAELGLSPEDVAVGVVARLEPPKGVEVFIRAVAQIPATVPVRALLVGDGSLEGRLRTLAKELGVSEHRLRFLGLRHDIPRLLSAFDLFVLPSHWEGLPGAIMEAMCAGLPVVASRVGGIPELVQEGLTGHLVPPGDPDALVHAILYLAQNPTARIRMGEAGFARITADFSLDQMVKRTEEIYVSLLRS
jgi:glycosyltransferase involved in cell wall biosynthesis